MNEQEKTVRFEAYNRRTHTYGRIACGVTLVLLLGALGVANMWEAVFADVGVSVIAILNAMRALKVEE